MSDEDWDSGFGKSITVYLNGQGIPDLDPRGQRVTDDSFVMCFNAHHEPIDFTLPPKEFGAAWQPVIYTVEGAVMEGSGRCSRAAGRWSPLGEVLRAEDWSPRRLPNGPTVPSASQSTMSKND